MGRYFGYILISYLLVGRIVAAPITPGISDIVYLGSGQYIGVIDTKGDQKGPRMKRLHLDDKKGLIITDITVPTPSQGYPYNDLEALCQIPERDNEFLLVESGYWKGRYGRVIHVKYHPDPNKPRITAINHFYPFPKPTETYQSTKAEQLEGVACLKSTDDQLWVVFGKRGKGSENGKIVWGKLHDIDRNISFEVTGEQVFDYFSRDLVSRDISTLYAHDIEDNAWELYAAATKDFGDWGPFRSYVYHPGRFEWSQEKGLQFVMLKLHFLYELDGMKVEGLSESPDFILNSEFSIVTDDENFGGVFRPLSLKK